MMEPITSFTGKYRFLSNFWPARVMLDGHEYASVEHAYQACKTIDQTQRAHIRTLAKASEAKTAGKFVTLRLDWDKTKVDRMFNLVWHKFYFNEALGDKLLATEDAELVEGNYWGDTFWGVCRGQGENYLGKVLMRVRRSIHIDRNKELYDSVKPIDGSK